MESPNALPRAATAGIAALLLGLALRISEGHYRPGLGVALVLAVAALPFALAAGLLRRERPASGLVGAIGPLPFAFGTLAGLALLALTSPGLYFQRAPGAGFAPLVAAGAAALAGAFALPRARLGRRHALAFAAVLAAGMLVAGAVTIHCSPSPRIDVWIYEQNAADALLHLRNPYAIEIPNAWPPAGATGGYSYYPYAPLSLFLTVPGFLAGDVRWSLLVAGAAVPPLLAAAFPREAPVDEAAALPRRAALLAIAFFAVRPVEPFLLEQAWNEPFAVALFTLATLLWMRGRLDVAAAAFGLAIACKQYLVVIAPLLLLFPGARPRHLAIAVAAGVATALPFLVVGAHDLVDDTLLVHLRWPPRYDALTVTSWLHARDGREASGLVSGLPPLAVFTGVAWRGWRRGRDAGGAVLAIAATLLTAFLVAKQAHANYYDLAIGLFVVGTVAAATQREAVAAAGGSVAPSRNESDASTGTARPSASA